MSPDPTELKVAIIGAGSMAREHIRAFRDVPGVRIAGIHSRTRSRAEALAIEFGIPGVFDSVEQLYEGTRAELAVVTVVETSVNRVSRACFEFPWTVLLEKPPGYDLHDAEEIHQAAESKGRPVLVGLNRRFLSSTRTADADLARAAGPRYIHVADQQSLETAAALGHPDVVVKNWMYANSIHVIDYFRIFGRGKVRSIVPIVPWEGEGSSVVIAKIEFDGGDLGLYEGIWRGPGPWATTITTRSVRWELRPLEHAAFQLEGERVLRPIESDPWDREYKPGFRLQAEHAVAAVRSQPSDSPTLANALETMRLIHDLFFR